MVFFPKIRNKFSKEFTGFRKVNNSFSFENNVDFKKKEICNFFSVFSFLSFLCLNISCPTFVSALKMCLTSAAEKDVSSVAFF